MIVESWDNLLIEAQILSPFTQLAILLSDKIKLVATQDQGFFFPTGYPKPEHSGSGKPVKSQCIWEPTGLPAGLAGIPVGLTGNWSNSIFFFFGLNSNARKVY